MSTNENSPVLAKLAVASISLAALLGATACTTTDPYSSTPRRNNVGTGIIAGAVGGAYAGREIDRRHTGGKKYTEVEQVCQTVTEPREEIVGKMLLRYASIPYDGGILRLALGQDMLVSSDYRGRGIGTALITKSLDVPAPTIHSGLSSLSKPLFEKFALPSIDRSQSYQLALSWKGFLRQSRDRAGKGHDPAARASETGDVLRASGVPVTELRAAMIVGPGSAAYEVIRDLVNHLPLMVTRW